MICYKDRTYCTFYLVCYHGHVCDKALTEDVKKDAKKAKMDISCYLDIPKCFVPFFCVPAPVKKKRKKK